MRRRGGIFLIQGYYYNGSTVLRYQAPDKNLTFFANFTDCKRKMELTVDANENITIYKSDPLMIASYFINGCQDNSGSNITVAVEWSQLDCVTKETVNIFSNHKGISVNFPPMTFAYGCHVIRAQVDLTGDQLSEDSTSTYILEKDFTVVPSDLVVKIWGGSSRSVGKITGFALLYFNFLVW